MRQHTRSLHLLLIALSALLFVLASSKSLAWYGASGAGDAGKTAEHFIALGRQGDDSSAPANCRYGAAPVYESLSKQIAAIPRLGAGWYLTFRAYPPEQEPSNGAEFMHMMKVLQNKDGFTYLPGYTIRPALNENFAQYLGDNPGGKWIVGNEVNRGPNPEETDPANRGQGDTFPDVYAVAYHDAYHFIKQHDPTAQVGTSGLVQVTPGRLQYLDKVWNAYLQAYGSPMPVDFWTMHVYVLPEVEPDGLTPNGIASVALGTDPALGKRSSGGKPPCDSPDVYCFAEHDDMSIFVEQVRAMRQWMKAHGQKEKPLLLTEFSILYPYEDDGASCYLQDEFGNCFTPQRVSGFMSSALDFLDSTADPSLGFSLDGDRLVQQWMWFSIHSPAGGSASNLLQPDLATFTQMGETFAGHAAADAPHQRLVAVDARIVVSTAEPAGAQTVNIPASFRNRGNQAIDQPFKVTFYEDAGLSRPIGYVNVSASIHGCSSTAYDVLLPWPNLTPGIYDYWYKLDSDGTLNQSQTEDGENVGRGRVIVISEDDWMPAVWK